MKHLFLTSLASLLAAPAPALADPGLHHHSHGIAAGWILAAAVLLATPVAVLAIKRVKK